MRNYHQLLYEALKHITEDEYENLEDADDFSGPRVVEQVTCGHYLIELREVENNSHVTVNGSPLHHNADISTADLYEMVQTLLKTSTHPESFGKSIQDNLEIQAREMSSDRVLRNILCHAITGLMMNQA